MSKVIVFGATGNVGQAIVSRLVADDHQVTAAARDPDNLPDGFATLRGDLRPARVDVRSATSVAEAVGENDVVISAIGPAGRKPEGLYSQGTQHIVDAMRGDPTRRLFAISSAGVNPRDPNLALWYRIVARTLLADLYSDMRTMEQVVTSSNLGWTILRLSRVTDNPATQFRIGTPGQPRHGTTIPRDSVATFIGTELRTARYTRQVVALAE